MNRLVTQLAEKLVELGYTIRTFGTPSPYRPPQTFDSWWQEVDPQTFYTVSPDSPQLRFRPIYDGEGERLARFAFPSSYVSPHPANNIAHGLADLRLDGHSRAALIFLHGHMMTRSTLFPLLLFSRQAIHAGFDLYYLSLPYHMLRTPPSSYSGQYSLNSDIEGSVLAFMQGVRDVRSLITWIEQEKKMPVALAGISLGAYTALMTSVVDARPRAVVSVLGGASLARIAWDGYQAGKVRRQLQAGGITLKQLERYWSLLSPGYWKSRLERDRILMIGGLYDEVVTPKNVKELWRAWNEPDIHWYPCGHVSSALYHKPISQELAAFLHRALLDQRGKSDT